MNYNSACFLIIHVTLCRLIIRLPFFCIHVYQHKSTIFFSVFIYLPIYNSTILPILYLSTYLQFYLSSYLPMPIYLSTNLPIWGFPLAQLLRNFCERKRNFLLSLRYIFWAKKNTLHNYSQTSFLFCAISRNIFPLKGWLYLTFKYNCNA